MFVIAGAGSGHKSATVPAPLLEPNIPAIAYRIEESWPLGREPVWRRSPACVASRVGAAVAGLAAGEGELRGAAERPRLSLAGQRRARPQSLNSGAPVAGSGAAEQAHTACGLPTR